MESILGEFAPEDVRWLAWVLLMALVAVGLAVAPRAAALAGTTERVSVSSSEAQANGDTQNAPALSFDGRFVAFFSRATNLGGPGGNVFVRDRAAGTTELVSVASDGTPGNGESGAGHGPAISSDGRFVAFESNASNLVAGDNNRTTDVFVRDRQAGTTERVSVDSGGQEGDRASVKPSISGDGRLVVFQSASQNLAPEDGICCDEDVFVHDRQTGTTSRVSVKRLTDRGVEPAGASEDGDISPDGRFVAFIGPCDLLAPCNGFQEPQVFLRDLQSGTTSQLTFGNSGAGAKNNPDVSSGGRFVAFEAAGTDLVPGDTNGTGDVFVVETATKAITRASVDSAGNQGNGNSSSALEGPAISDDGRKVAFESFATNLVPDDTNGVRDVFVHDLVTGQTTRESVDSAGNQANGPSTGSAISGDGNWVGFVSAATNLVPGDTNAHTDAFVHQLTEGITSSTSSSTTTSSPSSSTSSSTTTSSTSTSSTSSSTSTSTSSSTSSTSTSSTSTSAPTSTSTSTTSTSVPTSSSTSSTTTSTPPRTGLPRITAIQPATGGDVGGTRVVVVGTNLDQGVVFVDGNPVATEPCSPGPARPGRAAPRALCFVTPPHVPGDAEITVRTPAGTSNAAHFRYVATPPPAIDTGLRGITPNTGPDVGGTRVQLRGTNLDQGVVYIDGTPVPTERCGASLCFVTPPHAPGVVEVTIRTPNGNVSNPVTFRYQATPPPRIRAISPDHGPDVGGTRVRVSGDNLNQGVVYVDGVAVPTEPCGGSTSRAAGRSPAAAAVELCFVTPPHAPGTAVITVQTPNGKVSNAGTFRYEETPAPRIRTLTPSRGTTAGGTRVVVLGENLSQGTVYVDGNAVPTQSCTAAAPNVSTPLVRQAPGALCFVSPSHAAGSASVTVRTPNGKTSDPATFQYTGPRA